jgi:hypothetical protein
VLPVKNIFVLIVLCISAGDTFAQSMDSAVTTLRDYVDTRLRWSDWKQYSRFITWSDEPGWDCWWVAVDRSIGHGVRQDSDVLVPVTYSRLGLYCADFSFRKGKKNQVVRYRLVRRQNDWKVSGPMPDYPDISWTALKTWLEKTATNNQESVERRQQATNAIRQIGAAAK